MPTTTKSRVPGVPDRRVWRAVGAVLLAVLVLGTGYLPAPWPVDIAVAIAAVFLATSALQQARFTVVPAASIAAWALLTNLAFVVPADVNARLATLLVAVVISGGLAIHSERSHHKPR